MVSPKISETIFSILAMHQIHSGFNSCSSLSGCVSWMNLVSHLENFLGMVVKKVISINNVIIPVNWNWLIHPSISQVIISNYNNCLDSTPLLDPWVKQRSSKWHFTQMPAQVLLPGSRETHYNVLWLKKRAEKTLHRLLYYIYHLYKHKVTVLWNARGWCLM